MKSLKNVFFTLGVFALIAAGLVLLSRASTTGNEPADAALAVGQANFDFGTVSMANGPVSRVFTIQNSTDEPMALTKLYTSCMCTIATLLLFEETFGPFGMPGHGFIPPVDQTLPPGGEASLEVVFDPAAHGPAGVGVVERTITLETSHGRQLFTIKAKVTP